MARENNRWGYTGWWGHTGLTRDQATAIWTYVHHLDRTTPLWSRLEPPVEPALAALVAAGLRLAVVSNNDGRLRQQIDTAGIAAYFSAAIDSAEVGTAKSDPAIF